MLNSNEAMVGYDTITKTYRELFPEDSVDLGHFAYFSTLFGLTAAQGPHVRTIVEIGCQYGASTRAFLAATPRIDRTRAGNAWFSLPNQPERHVHSIDVDPEAGKTTAAAVAAMGCTDRWHFHLGRSQDIEPIDCDLLYVDGDHSYEAVCSDMARHGTRVRDGGLVVLDDYHWTWPGKMRWIDERWAVLDPLIIGPTAVVRVTPEKRQRFT